MIKAILLDIDGTLTNRDKVITPRTRDALLRAQEAGTTLVLASGRPAQGLHRFAQELDMFTHHGLFCCFNGAKVMDCQSGEVYFNQAITVSQAKRVLEHIKAFDINPVIDDGGPYMHTSDVFQRIHQPGGDPRWLVVEYEARNNGYLLQEHVDLAADISWEPNKIMTVGEPDYLQEHAAEISAPFEGERSAMFTAPFYYEFTPKGVDKAAALGETFAKLGIAVADTAAFGDAENDMTMLGFAGIGVAMGNAVEVTKAAADMVTDDNDHDGIATALEKLMPELF